MQTLLKRLASGALVVAMALGFAASASAQGDQQVLINQADTTLSNFMRDPEMKWLQQNIGRAKAVPGLVSPQPAMAEDSGPADSKPRSPDSSPAAGAIPGLHGLKRRGKTARLPGPAGVCWKGADRTGGHGGRRPRAGLPRGARGGAGGG